MKFPNFFRRKQPEIRADTPESNGQKLNILEFLFGIEGELTREAAVQIPTVSACIQKVADVVSRLPIKLYQMRDGKVYEITDDERLKLLNKDNGDTLSVVDMWRSVIEDYYVGGGGWIFINSDGMKTKSLHYVSDSDISYQTNNEPIFKAFYVLVRGQKYYDFQFIRILRKTKDGYTNIPIQQDNQKILSAAYSSLKLENLMSENGGCKSGFLKSKNRLSAEAIQNIQEGYKKLYASDKKNESKIVVLNDGIDFQEITSTAAELQLNENKRANSIEVCKIFGFPHTVIDGNMSESDKEQFISSVIAVLNQIETALDLYLLSEAEKENGFYFAFDTKEITRGSMLQRYQAYEIGLRNRFIQVDEVRKEEDYDPIGFNFVTLGLGDILLNPETKEVYTPNTNTFTNLTKGDDVNEN